MIKNILIENFNGHKSTEIEFSNGVNILIGNSRAGKTAVIRALKWILFNKPHGDSFRSDWGGDTSVSIEVNDNTIKRIKSKKENKYYINDDKEGYLAGTDVPIEVKRILNIDEINLQAQFDSPFLLAEKTSAGEVARYLNKIINLDSIDIGLSNLNKSIKDNKQKTRFEKERLLDLKEQEKEYDWLGKAEKELVVIEELEKEVSSLKTEHENLNDLVAEIQIVDFYLDMKSHYAPCEDKVGELIELKNELDSLYNSHDELEELIKDKKTVIEDINEINEILEFEDEVNKLIEIQTEIGDLEVDKYRLKEIIEEIETVEDKLEQLIEHKNELEEIYEEAFPEECPLCGK